LLISSIKINQIWYRNVLNGVHLEGWQGYWMLILKLAIKVGCECVKWIKLTQDWVQHQAVMLNLIILLPETLLSN
jgi:hypothetical protein